MKRSSKEILIGYRWISSVCIKIERKMLVKKVIRLLIVRARVILTKSWNADLT